MTTAGIMMIVVSIILDVGPMALGWHGLPMFSRESRGEGSPRAPGDQSIHKRINGGV